MMYPKTARHEDKNASTVMFALTDNAPIFCDLDVMFVICFCHLWTALKGPISKPRYVRLKQMLEFAKAGACLDSCIRNCSRECEEGLQDKGMKFTLLIRNVRPEVRCKNRNNLSIITRVSKLRMTERRSSAQAHNNSPSFKCLWTYSRKGFKQITKSEADKGHPCKTPMRIRKNVKVEDA